VHDERLDTDQPVLSWVPNPSIVPEKLMLIVSELGEAVEAHRKGAKDQHLPQFDGLTAELADAVIRILDLAHHCNLPLADAIEAKHKYNKSRPYKHGKEY
jgi:NTP pyrophosphatase (non-canonical NTP hydrolase)